MPSIAFPIFEGLPSVAADLFLAQSMSPTHLDPVFAVDPFRSQFCAADSGDDGGAAAASISPHFDEILDTFETRPETGELIFPRLEARPGGFEVRPTVLTQETAVSLNRLRTRIVQEIRRLMPDEEDIYFIRLTPVWECTLDYDPEKYLHAIRHHYAKQIVIIEEKEDRTRIETIVGKEGQQLSGMWAMQNSQVELLQYEIEMPLDGLRLFLDLPRPIDYTAQARLLLATLGIADFEAEHETETASETWRFEGRNGQSGFWIRIGLEIFLRGRIFIPPTMFLSFMTPQGDDAPRPLEGEALRLWNWVRDGVAK